MSQTIGTHHGPHLIADIIHMTCAMGRPQAKLENWVTGGSFGTHLAAHPDCAERSLWLGTT